MTPTITTAISVPVQEAISRAMRDYAEGWYAGDQAQMRRALHPALAKRAVLPAESQALELSEYTAEALIERVGRNSPALSAEAPKQCDVTILDVRGNAATGRLVMDHWTDFMHLVLVDGTWQILNILWEPK